MKQFITTTLACFSLGIMLSGNVFAQTYKMKDSISNKDQSTFLGNIKRVFPLNVELAYNITSNDSRMNYEDMNDRIIYNDLYRKAYLDSLKADPKNPFLFSKLAYYYQNIQHKDSTSILFHKSLDNMTLEGFDGDSSKYYSFRSTVKYNLGMASTESDVKATLRLNPLDDNAIGMYAIYLIQNGKYDEAEEICTNALTSKKNTSEIPMLMYTFSKIYRKATVFAPMTKKEKTPFIKKDIMELIDFKSMDKFAKKTKKVQVLQNTYQMSKILALVMKATIFRQDEFFNPILEYTENDVKLIQELIEWNTTSIENKTLNNFSANKNLATLYWMIGETDSMMKHARIAIRDFPIQKTTTSFDADDIFSVVLLSLKMQKNYPEFEQTLFSDIEATKIVNLSPIESHINLAKLNLYREDFEKCAEHLVIAKNIDENNLELNRVIIQYHLAMGNMDDFQAYINKCRDMEKTDVETGNLALQLGFYNLFVGDAQEAYNTLSIAKEKLEGCTLCDQMIEKYIEVGE